MKLKSFVFLALVLLSIQLVVAESSSDPEESLGGLCCCFSFLAAPIAIIAGILGTTMLFAAFWIGLIAFYLFGLYSCLTKHDWINPNDKIIWVIVILLMPFIGTIFFFIYEHVQEERRRRRQ